jgi:hypothetical protein
VTGLSLGESDEHDLDDSPRKSARVQSLSAYRTGPTSERCWLVFVYPLSLRKRRKKDNDIHRGESSSREAETNKIVGFLAA